MKHKTIRLEHGLHRPLRFPNHLVGDPHFYVEFSHDLCFGLVDRKLLCHDCGSIRATDVTDHLFAGTAKTKLVIGSIASPLFAHRSLGRQLVQVGCR